MSGPGALWDTTGATWDSGVVWDGSFVNSLQFLDETRLNPLPAGILVAIYPTGPLQNGLVLGDAVGIGWTQPGGFVTNLNLVFDKTYIATFQGSFQAPSPSITFTPNSAVYKVTVAPYRSPSMFQAGYAAFECSKLPKGWFSDAAKQAGGIAYAISSGYGKALQDLDVGQNQYVLQEMRLQSSVGSQIDSWSADMVTTKFGRYVGELDPAFIARNIVMVQRPKTTIDYITQIVQAFYNSTAGTYKSLGELLAYGVPGAGGFGMSGGFGVAPPPPSQNPSPIPPVFVWDAMTEPTLASQLGVVAPQFVIQIGYIEASLTQQLAYGVKGAGGFSVGQGGFSTVNTDAEPPTLSNAAPDPRLGLLINWISKGAGTQPLYLVGTF